MGVVNRSEPNCETAKSPNTVPTTDMLIIPAPSAEFVTFNFLDLVPTAPVLAVNSSPSPRRRLGRRRQRRASAEAELLALMQTEEPEGFLSDGIPHNSPFQTLMNSEYSTILENFIDGDMDEQEKLLGLQPVGRRSRSKPNSESYAKVSPKIKLALKTTRNLYQLQKLEDEIVDFLTNHPADYYLNSDASRFQRLLMHGIAQYYGLKSHSFDTEDGKRVIKVGNPNLCNFTEKRLYAVVKKNHGKKSN